MKRRRFIKTSVGFAGIGLALSPSHDLFARFELQDAGKINSKDATRTLARFISDFRYENLSRQAVEAAKVGIIDGVGVMLAGSTYRPLAALMAGYVREMGGVPRCSVVGWGFKTNAPSAAFANGVFGHCPEAFKAFLAFYRPLKYGGRLDFALKELVRLRIAALNDCER